MTVAKAVTSALLTSLFLISSPLTQALEAELAAFLQNITG